MKRLVMPLAALFAFALAAALSFQSGAALAAAGTAAKSTRPGIVVLFRGGANVFSTGMDELAEKLRAKNVNAISEGHASWKQAVDEMRANYAKKRQPIILLGHSFGANAALLAAQELNKSNIPVALIILFDPTAPMKVPSNVSHLINYYSGTFANLGLEVKPGAHFGGELENVGQTDIGHLDLDNDVRLHVKAIAEIMSVLGRRASVAAE